MDDRTPGGYQGEEHFYKPDKLEPMKRFWRRPVGITIISIIVVFVIVFASMAILLARGSSQSAAVHPSSGPAGPVAAATSTPAPTPTDTPTPSALTPTPIPGTTATATPNPVAGLPCVVDLSTWSGGSQDWTVHNGALYNDGTNTNTQAGPTIIAPCQPGTPNYAVEAKIQVTTPAQDPYPHSDHCFGIILRGSSGQNGWQGYRAEVCGLDTAYISAYGDNNPLTQAPFTPGTTTHTYRAEVKDNSIKLFIDGNLVDTANDNRLLTQESGQGVGLYSQYVQLQVSSFRVVAL